MPENTSNISLFEDRPFFERALRLGVQQGVVNPAKIAMIEADAPKGMVQIAEAFGSKYLRPEIETARKRIVNLVSLYLSETANGDLDVAAKLIRDNSFLSLSRGGSSLIKALFAMPEYALLGREEKGRVEDFLEYWSRKESPIDYQKALAQRKANLLDIEAGFWFGEQLELERVELQEQDADAESVIRTAMLLRLAGKANSSLLNQVEFAGLLDQIRAKGIKAKKTAKSKAEEIPEKYRAIAERIQKEVAERDLPRIQDLDISLDKLVYELKDRYYLRDYEVEDTSEYDALVSKEWTKVTKGKSDIDSLLTLFLCLAADLPPKTSLSEAGAKKLVKKIRDEGFHPEAAAEFIQTAAPHEKQESLLADWEEFVEEANNYLLDDWDSNYTGAMRFLRENCYIEKAVKK
ncbi:hypothetical protein [Undibacterium sp.]|jgi:hypothetical protein|uniref:hypothetical protein n=1 Tax=Undibacterium sp. TaxID=1914977 RepID=UPI002BC8C27C|nr:hypothetical protein [Undibacterium sp.]HTD05029.1 hypothetical protein [Undibacterium sp.]